MSSGGRYGYSDDDDEISRLLNTIPPGMRKRSINGTLSGIPEPPEETKSRWRSIRVMYLTMFLSSVSFSICVSSLYPYLKILDSTSTTNFLGWVVAAYSVGQLVASPFFGFWSNFRSRSREPIVVSLVINILANVLYMYLESIKLEPQIFLVVARIFVGFGAGNVAVVRSYVSGATTLEERTSAMANMSAFQAIGFIIGPLIQTALVPVGFPGPVYSPALHFDLYTATGFFSAVVGVVNIVLLVLVFKEHKVKNDEYIYRNIQEPTDTEDTMEDLMPPDYKAVVSSIVIFFVVLFVFAVFETIATPLAMHMFSWTKAGATLYVGLALGGAGFVSIGVVFVIKALSKRFNERNLLLGGFVLCFVGFVVYLPWGHTYPDIQYAENDGIAPANITAGEQFWYSARGEAGSVADRPVENNLPPTSMFFRPTNNFSSNSSQEATGCPYYYDWCFNTPKVFLWQYILGTFFVALGYPTCNIISYAIYSKILGPKPQGTWMGWLTAAGSLARTLGPVFVSQVYDAYGPRVTFVSILGIIVVTFVGLLAVYKRLVPYPTAPKIVRV